jgi:hypothetical protein
MSFALATSTVPGAVRLPVGFVPRVGGEARLWFEPEVREGKFGWANLVDKTF